MALETYLSSRPGISLGPIPGTDKAVHAAYYGLIALSAARAAVLGHRWTSLRIALVLIPTCAFLGVLDELHQAFVPGRDADPWDAVADTLGAAVGALVGPLIWRPRLPPGEG